MRPQVSALALVAPVETRGRAGVRWGWKRREGRGGGGEKEEAGEERGRGGEREERGRGEGRGGAARNAPGGPARTLPAAPRERARLLPWRDQDAAAAVAAAATTGRTLGALGRWLAIGPGRSGWW